ncbi:hypothetical protein JH06_0736 [Blastocystis sp. subtype 4]|uniref:hypothetical protein n=1 Tax=Blastocystis sp. subtype 4 TaxID=944170 RepID=UPI00071194E8|nr:hypothetical protein JH06_0736 [Blastocystis sp. subtype 4]KNB45698.1 hypothetical protein JH06_0736 [Blastocystis sp. subtype 4]|eukprot:XP_014529141.1 hypothetical protein JH06_0736 [Blastocystis sp. subtype 4]
MRAKVPVVEHPILNSLNRKERELNLSTLNSNMYSDATLFCVELTATEPMDHDSLVTSQAMYAYDDDKIAFMITVKDEDGKDRIINAYTELLGVVGDCSLFVDIVDDRSNG